MIIGCSIEGRKAGIYNSGVIAGMKSSIDLTDYVYDCTEGGFLPVLDIHSHPVTARVTRLSLQDQKVWRDYERERRLVEMQSGTYTAKVRRPVFIMIQPNRDGDLATLTVLVQNSSEIDTEAISTLKEGSRTAVRLAKALSLPDDDIDRDPAKSLAEAMNAFDRRMAKAGYETKRFTSDELEQAGDYILAHLPTEVELSPVEQSSAPEPNLSFLTPAV